MSPVMEPMLTMVPLRLAAMCGNTAWERRRTENTLVSNVFWARSRGISMRGPEQGPPALFTMMSTRPSRSSTVFTTSATSSSEVTSNFSVEMFGSLKPSIASGLRAVAYTLHPFAANSSHLYHEQTSITAPLAATTDETHNANPIPPFEQPVTMTTLLAMMPCAQCSNGWGVRGASMSSFGGLRRVCHADK